MLDVFLRGSRNYVQGSQIIARTAALLGGGGWSLEQAAFSHITANRVAAVPATAETGAKLGTVRFSRMGETADFAILDTSEAAPKRDTALGVTVRRVGGEGESAEWAFGGPQSLEGRLNAVIQAVKGEHEHRYAGARDIWLTGFRGLRLPADADGPDGEGRVFLTMRRLMAGDGASQTLWSVRMEAAGAALADGFVTFAFKPAGDGHGA